MSAEHEETHDHDRGLQFDLSTLMTRRRALGLAALGGLGVVIGCGSSSEGSAGGTTTASASATTPATTDEAAAAAAEIPEETAGPFPADGSNGVNVLTESGVVRSDIVSSFGSASGTAEGVPMALEMTIIDVAGGGGVLPGAAVYVWHCDRDGRYSLYEAEVADQNYLRGVQEAGADGAVRFTSIWPGAYSGRWPHVHFEVYPSLAEATGGGAKLATSQIALPEEASTQVYATAGYEQSVRNLAGTSLAGDMVFSDGYSAQLGTASGSPAHGMAVSLNVGV